MTFKISKFDFDFEIIYIYIYIAKMSVNIATKVLHYLGVLFTVVFIFICKTISK